MIKHIIYLNIWLSFLAGFLCFSFSSYIGVKSIQSFYLGTTVLFATLFIYSVHRLYRMENVEEYSKKNKWLNQRENLLKTIVVISFFMATILYFFFIFQLKSFFLLVFLGLISFFYSRKSKVFNKPLRELPTLKIHLIAITWTVVCFVWPIIFSEKELINYAKEILVGYTFMVSITIPFDIRDLKFDKIEQKTIPQIVGVNGAKIIATVVLLGSLSIILTIEREIVNNFFTYITYGGLALLIFFTAEKRKEFFYSALVDGWVLFFSCIWFFS